MARRSVLEVLAGRRRTAPVVRPAPELQTRINGQSLAWKAAAGFVAGPALLYASVAPTTPLVRLGLASIGTAVTVVDAGHVMRHVFRRHAEQR